MLLQFCVDLTLTPMIIHDCTVRGVWGPGLDEVFLFECQSRL